MNQHQAQMSQRARAIAYQAEAAIYAELAASYRDMEHAAQAGPGGERDSYTWHCIHFQFLAALSTTQARAILDN